MNTRDCSRTRGTAGCAAGIQLGKAILALLVLGACSSVPDAVNPVQWYKSAEQAVFGDGQSATASAEAASAGTGAPAYTPPEIPGGNQPFPNLGDGPERPVARTPAETSALTEGLVADRARSRHSERGIPLQGMSGERRAGLPMMTDGEPPPDMEASTVATAPSSPEVIRTETSRAAAPRPAGAGQGPAGLRGPSGTAGETTQSTTAGRTPRAAQTPDAPATTGAQQQASSAPSRMAFSDAAPPSGPPSGTSPSAAPPRPRFSDVAPPTLGLSSAPPPRQQQMPANAPVAAAPDLLPPPPGIAATGTGAPSQSASGSGPSSAPRGVAEAREALVEEEDARDVAAGNMTGNMAALDQTADEAAEPARSERIATIQFGLETAELGAPEREVLRQVAALHQQRGGMIRVVGHGGTDSEGESAQGDTTTEQISLERANIVAQELIRLGVSRQEIRAVALTGATAAGETDAQAAEIYFVY